MAQTRARAARERKIRSRDTPAAAQGGERLAGVAWRRAPRPTHSLALVRTQGMLYLSRTVSALSDSPRTMAVLDPFGGLAGDMLLGAILDLGVDHRALADTLASLGLPDWSLERAAVTRRHLGCTKAEFRVPEEHGHRHLPEIRERIAASSLDPRAKAKADAAFVRLAEAEAAVHRIPVDEVHFHEVGAADAILDICGVSAGLVELGVEEIVCGPLPGGSGTIRCEHGDMPCPAPAVVHLLEDFVILAGVGEGEMVTPTGAALLCAWGRPLRAGELAYSKARAGYGAGTRSASILRLSLVEPRPLAHSAAAPSGTWLRDEICELETHLDDESPELLAWLGERLFELGAVDVAFLPLTMKKGRPGVCLRVLVPPARREAAIACILGESSALGVREQTLARTVLPRAAASVDTRWGPVVVKRAGARLRPEYEALAALARSRDLPLHVVRSEVEAACRRAEARDEEEAERG